MIGIRGGRDSDRRACDTRYRTRRSRHGILAPEWGQFVPTLLATAVGVGLGYGASQHITRQADNRADRKRKQDEKDRVNALTEMVRSELDDNAGALHRAMADLKSKPHTDSIPTSDIWKAIRPELIPHLNGDQLRALIESYVTVDRAELLLRLYLQDVRGDATAIARTCSDPAGDRGAGEGGCGHSPGRPRSSPVDRFRVTKA